MEGGSFTRDIERWMKGALEIERLSLRKLCEGNLEGGIFYWGSRRMCKGRLLNRVFLSIEAPLESLEEGSPTGYFKRWMKGALGMEHLSLKRLSGQGLEGGSFSGDPERYVKKGSGYGHLSP
jgi:hypothetical protein